MRRKVLIGVAVLVVAGAAAAYLLYSNLGAIVKAAIEKYGSEAARAPVRVGRVTLSPASGEGAISGLTIGNPAGFTTPAALVLGSVSLKVDVASLRGDPIVVREIVIAGPAITCEAAAGGSNLEALRQNVRRYAGAGGSAGSPGGPARRIVIEHLYVRDGRIAVRHAALGGRTLSVRLPTIHLRDIGKQRGGATPAEVAQRVLGAIAESANRAAMADLERALARAGGAVADAARKAPSEIGEIGGRLKDLLRAR